EIAAIRSSISRVAFEKIPKGRSRPLITDFFSAATASGNKIAGIINADCMMINHFQLIKHLKDRLDGIVIAERLNLSQETLRPTGLGTAGFDAFFFDVAALSQIEHDNHWEIGGVWADYWLPLAFHVAGFNIKTLPAPILLHLEHEQAWSWEAWKSECSKIIRLMKANETRCLDRDMPASLAKAVHTDDVGTIQRVLSVWLKSREPLWTPS